MELVLNNATRYFTQQRTSSSGYLAYESAWLRHFLNAHIRNQTHYSSLTLFRVSFNAAARAAIADVLASARGEFSEFFYSDQAPGYDDWMRVNKLVRINCSTILVRVERVM